MFEVNQMVTLKECPVTHLPFSLSKNKVYKVLDISGTCVKIQHDGGDESWYFDRHFVPAFKCGDTIVCINSNGNLFSLTLGKEYNVIRGVENRGPTTILIKDDGGSFTNFDMSRFKLKDEVETVSDTPTKDNKSPIIKLEDGKTYVTAGGYVVKIIHCNTFYYATIETSPGVNSGGQDITKVRIDCPLKYNSLTLGWCYYADGTISLGSGWSEKLRIVKELPEGIPTIPSGFQWAGGYPQCRVPVEGEQFFGLKSDGTHGHYVTTMKDQTLVGTNHQRFIVEKINKEEKKEVTTKLVIKVPKLRPSQVPDDLVEVTDIKDYVITKGDGYTFKDGSFHRYTYDLGRTIESLFVPDTRDWATKENYENYQKKVKSVAQKSSSTDVEKCPDTHIDVSDCKDYITKDTDLYLGYKEGQDLLKCSGGYTVSQCNVFKIFALKENYEEYQKLLTQKDAPDIVIPKGMIEVTHLKEYCPKGGDVYLTKDANTTYPITSFYAVKHWRPTTRIWATKENYLEWTKLKAIEAGVSSPADVTSVTSVTNVTKEEETEMSEALKFETAKAVTKSVGGFVGRMGWRGLNYWLFEPTKEVATKVMRTVRYITLATTVCGGIYAYNYPESAKDTLFKCLPKISISVDAPEIIRG